MMHNVSLYTLTSIALIFHSFFFFFFNDTATTEIYTLSLHDALPIWISFARSTGRMKLLDGSRQHQVRSASASRRRSEEHTSELQSPYDLVCRLLLEKKKKTKKDNHIKKIS